MNIKEVSIIVDISPQNIRYYEKVNLIQPYHNPINQYREYTEADIERLKQIKLLRSLEVPIETIQQLYQEKTDLATILSNQMEHLQNQAQQLDQRIAICQSLLTHQKEEFSDIVSESLQSLPNDSSSSWFKQMQQDYLNALKLENMIAFTFTPKDYIETAQDFTKELTTLATTKNAECIFIQEGLSPKFLWNGIPYQASRTYLTVRGVPLQRVRCEIDDIYLQKQPKKLNRYRLLLKILVVLVTLIFAWSYAYRNSNDIYDFLASGIGLSAIVIIELWFFRYYFTHDKQQ